MHLHRKIETPHPFHQHGDMNNSKDLVIHELVKKKKTLLKQLLSHSIQAAIDEPDFNSKQQDRDQLRLKLETNEKALEKREKDLGVRAGNQEARLFHEIQDILMAIQANNEQTISKLEKEMKEIERERSRLQHGNKLSGYIAQQNKYRQRRPATANALQQPFGNRLLNGTM